uniref:NAC domain-containing protein n=1 Tax=Populus davidiana TaxID=266767 RepID=A0A6M2E7Z8_9ROSI
MDDYFSSFLAFFPLLMDKGFKFQPTNEELLSEYLVPKTRGDIMGGFPMAVVNLCEHEPWDLPGRSIIKFAGQVTWYFFCPRDLRGKVHRRKTKAGYWKLTCRQKSITAEGTKKKIGVMRTLRFYENEVRTGWMMYELDLIANSSQFKKGQYVLCKLEFHSKGEKSKEGEQSHHIAPVSHSEVEPSQGMDSDSENINLSEMAMRYSPCDESELSHHAGSHFGNQNPSELMNNSARQLGELSHHMASEFRNQNSNNLTPSLVYDGSGLSHSTVNFEDLYWNQPTVDPDYNGSESPYMAFDSENKNPNELLTFDNLYWNQPTVDPDYNGSESPYMAFDSENKNPNELLTFDNLYWNQPTVDPDYNGSESPYMAFDSENKNPNELLTFDNSASNVSKNHGMAFGLANHNPNGSLTVDNSTSNVSESHHTALGLENQNLNNSISILTCENSLMASRGLETQEPPSPPYSFINQSTYNKSESSSLMAFDFENQNLVKEFDISAFGDGAWSNTTATPPDFGNQNPCKKTDMSTLEEGYSSYSKSSFPDNDLADVALLEVRAKYHALQILFNCSSGVRVANPKVILTLHDTSGR